jgi:hypothetical protein
MIIRTVQNARASVGGASIRRDSRTLRTARLLSVLTDRHETIPQLLAERPTRKYYLSARQTAPSSGRP